MSHNIKLHHPLHHDITVKQTCTKPPHIEAPKHTHPICLSERGPAASFVSFFQAVVFIFHRLPWWPTVCFQRRLVRKLADRITPRPLRGRCWKRCYCWLCVFLMFSGRGSFLIVSWVFFKSIYLTVELFYRQILIWIVCDNNVLILPSFAAWS